MLTKSAFRTAARQARVILHGRPHCLALARSIVSEKDGIEIGGPSTVFRSRLNLPVYDVIGTLDNCDFSQDTTWANHQEVYRFHPAKAPGRSYFAEGSDLHAISDHSYEFLLSSHNLEHFANPIRALKEWQRIVKPGGGLLVVLPDYRKTPDRRRKPTAISHLLDDFKQNMAENDLTHVEETVQAQQLDGLGPTAADDLRKLLSNNLEHRMMHHHVFDEENSRQLLEAIGCTVLAVETQLPFHIYLLAQFPKGK